MNNRRRAQEFALSFFGRDPADAADARRAAPLEASCGPSDAVIDNRHALARNEPGPRLRHEPARGDDRGIRAAQRFACHPSRQARADVTVGMKNYGQAQSRQRRRRQQSRAVHINQIGLYLFRQLPNLPRESRRPAEEAQRVHWRFPAGAIGPALHWRRLKTQRADLIEQGAIAGHAYQRVPAALPYGGQHLQQRLLRAARIAELVQDE